MTNAPEECLAARDTINAKSHRDAEHMSSVQQRGDDAATPLHGRRPVDSLGNTHGVSRVKKPVWTKVKVDAHIGEAEQRAGCEGDGSILVVGVKTGFGSLLPPRSPGTQASSSSRS